MQKGTALADSAELSRLRAYLRNRWNIQTKDGISLPDAVALLLKQVSSSEAMKIMATLRK